MRAKAQHYVPRFYLKNFSKKKGSKYITQCYSKQDGKVFSVNITKICQENGFYDVKTDDYLFSIEENLAEFESKVAPVYKKLVDSKKLSVLDNEGKIAIATFVILQMLRTPEQRISFRHMEQQLADRFPGFEKNFVGERNKENSISHITFLNENVNEFVFILMQLKWVLILAPDHSFWTSDNPVYKHNELKSKFRGTLGLACKSIQVILPLSHNLLLMIFDGDTYTNIKTDEVTANSENIKHYNFGQIVCSIRHIFGEKPNFTLAEKILRESPEYMNPDRIRTKMS